MAQTKCVGFHLRVWSRIFWSICTLGAHEAILCFWTQRYDLKGNRSSASCLFERQPLRSCPKLIFWRNKVTRRDLLLSLVDDFCRGCSNSANSSQMPMARFPIRLHCMHSLKFLFELRKPQHGTVRASKRWPKSGACLGIEICYCTTQVAVY